MQTRRTSGFVLKIIIFSAILVMALTFLCISSVITSSQYGPRADAMSRQNAPQELKVGVSLPHAMIYPPKGLLFDAKRLIFAKPGDTLDIKVAPNPVGAVLPEARLTSTNEKIVRVEPSGKVTCKGGRLHGGNSRGGGFKMGRPYF